MNYSKLLISTIMVLGINMAHASCDDEHNNGNTCNGANIPGPVGPMGPSGTNGLNGTNGINGTNGKNGIDGANIDPLALTQLKGGIALGLATASHQYDVSFSGMQGSVAVGHFDGENAVSLGLGKRMNNMFLNLNVSQSSTKKTGMGAGLGFKF